MEIVKVAVLAAVCVVIYAFIWRRHGWQTALALLTVGSLLGGWVMFNAHWFGLIK